MRFFRLHLAATPSVSTVAFIGSDRLLSSNKILPMLGTLPRGPGVRPTPLYAGFAVLGKLIGIGQECLPASPRDEGFQLGGDGDQGVVAAPSGGHLNTERPAIDG